MAWGLPPKLQLIVAYFENCTLAGFFNVVPPAVLQLNLALNFAIKLTPSCKGFDSITLRYKPMIFKV